MLLAPTAPMPSGPPELELELALTIVDLKLVCVIELTK
jgi:hypothetical protein